MDDEGKDVLNYNSLSTQQKNDIHLYRGFNHWDGLGKLYYLVPP